MSETIKAPNSPRRNVYIDKAFQTRFMLKFFTLVICGAGMTIGLLYLMTRFSTTVSIVKSRVVVMTTADFLMPYLLRAGIIVTLIIGVATLIVTLFVSHKIAGPLYRFRQTFKDLAQGNFSKQIRLRQNDQLVEMAAELNRVITVVQAKAGAAQATTKSIRTELEALGQFNADDPRRAKIDGLKVKLQELENAVGFFKI